MQTNRQLVTHLINTSAIRSPDVIEAFSRIDRIRFVPVEWRNRAYEDMPLPIWFDATISQPSTVGLMLEWLKLSPGQKVLDVGSGSGWTTALIAYIVGKEGRVIGVERIPELVEFGQSNTSTHQNAVIYHSDHLGWPDDAPFDRILVSAAADALPRSLLDQLKQNGVLVIPVNNSIWVVTKQLEKYSKEEHQGFVFVPLHKPY